MTRSLIRSPLHAYLLAAVVVVFDQVSKLWILNGLDLADRGQVVLTPFFKLTLVWNRGVSFGLFRADQDVVRWLLVIFAVIVVGVLVVWARKQTRPQILAGLGLIIGGAIGNNFIDRVRYGAVVDFFDFSPLFPWVFNVADSAITVGVVLLLLDSLRKPRTPPAAP